MWDHFFYGVCYYPEHWNPNRHASDIKRIADCGFDLVRLGEGAWSYWEPAEGKFQFDLFDRVIDLCKSNGIKVIMGTPTYCAPAWVSEKYPEVLRWNFERVPMAHGSRRNLNYTSPKYYELSNRICSAMAQHYKNEKQIIGWQLDNEFNCHMDVSYAPSDTIAFREWLKAKYKTLAALNKAWGTAFWSLVYDQWEQIDLPSPTPTWMNPSLLLDETRFISDCVIRFADSQAKILRSANKNWLITHNGLFNNIDGPKLVEKALDFFSHDQYPLFHAEGAWTGYASPLIQARSLSFPFAILEQQSGPGGQMGYLLRTPRPGQMRLWAWQSIAHGANLLSFFRWRTCPYGAEQHWHGLLDADDRDNRRIAEAKQFGQEIRKVPREFFDAPVSKSFAVFRDFDNEANDRRINTYNKDGAGEAWKWLAEINRRHVPGDFVWASSDFTGYRVIVVPHLKIVDKTLVENFRQFVEAGGTLVLTAQSGSKDKNCHIVDMPLPGLLRKLAGIEVEDWTTLSDTESREARLPYGNHFSLDTVVERLKLIRAEAVAHWTSGDSLLDQSPAITRNRVGRGTVYYVGGYCNASATSALMTYLMDQLYVRPLVDADDAVEVIERTSGPRKFLFLMNHGSSAKRVGGLMKGKNWIDKTRVDEEILLGGYGVALVELFPEKD